MMEGGNRILFGFDHKCFPLADLEIMYAQGLITRNDTVFILEPGKPPWSAKISGLIMIYGEEFPFRMIPRSYVPEVSIDGDVEINGTSDGTDNGTWVSLEAEVLPPENPETSGSLTASESKGEGIEVVVQDSALPGNSSEVDAELQPTTTEAEPPQPPKPPKMIMLNSDCYYIFQDYPLFHVKDQPEHDLITGQDVLDEIEKLKAIIPLKPEPKEHKEYFYFLSRVESKVELRPRVAFCRLCGNMPFASLYVLLHLFDEEHAKKLSQCKVSKSSFTFWREHMEHCERMTGYRKNHSEGYLPLLNGDIWQADKDRMSPEEIGILVNEFSKISDVDFINEKFYVTVIFRNVLPTFCETCQWHMPSQKYQYAQHLFSEKHLKNLRGVIQRDVDFWIDAFKVPYYQMSDHVIRDVNAVKPIFDQIPLSHCDRRGEKRYLDDSEIEMLVKLGAMLGPQTDNWYLLYFYEAFNLPRGCSLCNEGFPRLHSNKRLTIPVTKHILSEQHLQRLSPVYQSHINFWLNLLNLEVTAKRVRSEDKLRILSVKNACPIPLIDFKLDADFMEESQRLPKIDELYEIFQRIKMQTLNDEPIMLGNTGKELAVQEVTCFACDTPKQFFENKCQLVNHLFSKRHVNYLLRFGFSQRAFQWWKSTLESFIDPEKPERSKSVESLRKPQNQPKKQTKPKKKPQEIANFKVLDSSEDSEEESGDDEIDYCSSEDEEVEPGKVVEEGIKPNIIRVPLLDKPLEGADMVPTSQWNPLGTLSRTITENCTELQLQRARTMMNYTAPKEEIDYWKHWAHCIINDVIIQNDPRIPMLDPPGPGAVAASKEELDSTLAEISSIIMVKDDSFISTVGAEDRIQLTCSICSDLEETYFFIDKSEAMDHIQDEEHQEKMKGQATEADLHYWKDYVKDLRQRAITLEKERHERRFDFYGEIIDRPRNSPSVPLLDFPPIYECRIGKWEFKEKYYQIREILSQLSPCELTLKEQNCVCYHCPEEPKMSTIWETLQHIFDGLHCQHINFFGTADNFRSYRRLMAKIMKVQLPLPPQPSVELPPTTRQKPIELCYKLEMCMLPLFAINYFGEKRCRICPGPTYEQIDFLQRMTIKDGGQSLTFFEKSTKCQICKIDMSEFTIQDVVRHAFSLKHLYKYEAMLDMFFIDEFDWWLEKLKSSEFIEAPETKAIPFELHLGGLKPMMKNSLIPDFNEFSEEENQLISNLDKSKVQEHEEILLRRFGGCVYCDLWILDPTAIIAHFLSEQHFEKVREHHPVKQFDVDDIMSFVKLCQKDNN